MNTIELILTLDTGILFYLGITNVLAQLRARKAKALLKKLGLDPTTLAPKQQAPQEDVKGPTAKMHKGRILIGFRMENDGR
jgi:hypothetical protein